MSRKGMEACGDVGILARCEDLHMINTGAAEDFHSSDRARKHIEVLNTVLNNWVYRGSSKWDAYDQCVRDLINITLNEERVWK